MAVLAHAFGVNGTTFVFNAVDSKFYRLHSVGEALPTPVSADFMLGLPDGEIRAHLARGPKLLMLNVTEQCNMRCTYCAFSGIYPSARTHSDRRMSEATARRAIDWFATQVAGREEAYISFYGGEPLLAIELIRTCVWYARERYAAVPFQFALTTNGTLLTPEIADFLVENGFDVAVSLDGPAGVHDAARVFASGGGTWAGAMRALARLHDRAPEHYRSHVNLVAVVVDRSRIEEMHEFFRTEPLVREQALLVSAVNTQGIDPAAYAPATPDEQAAYEAYLDTLEQQYIADLLDHPDAVDTFAEGLFGSAVACILQRSVGSLPAVYMPPGPCVPGAEKLFVSATGVLHTCEKMGEGLPLGDIERGLDDDACVRLMQEFIALNRADCESCWAVRFCPVCAAMARLDGGLSLERRRASCAGVLRNFERALRIYVSVTERDPGVWARHSVAQRGMSLHRWLE